ncbi:uncharacterized protein BXIN_0608 [Babesia sp. Xinjiang]|uniref:uncharacterized protein n=1 Tax=Babesia sp. Xinjiang TaxID=462227 RepID=UPI000A25CBE9|nr:uncharacterized protein BXIN_0608 [Babesia sp. Xinjiang]ORM41789.1 hypothetical protein BXIN_0608 [Babesia sp. Xinjiang]
MESKLTRTKPFRKSLGSKRKRKITRRPVTRLSRYTKMEEEEKPSNVYWIVGSCIILALIVSFVAVLVYYGSISDDDDDITYLPYPPELPYPLRDGFEPPQ